MLDSAEKVALVTGGAHRVGRSIVLALADHGYHVAVHYYKTEEGAQWTADQVRQRGLQAWVHQADLRKVEDIARLFTEFDTQADHLDCLVNSAAILAAHPLQEVTESDWRDTMDLNLKGAFFTLQAAARRMEVRGGVIINISDLLGIRPTSRFSVHGISKAGVEMLTRTAALALAPSIRVNAIAPGPVLKPEAMGDERWGKITEGIPLKRGGSAKDIARAVLFLLESEFITGETLVVDGGAQWAP